MSRWHNYYLDSHAHFCTASVSGFRPLLVGQSTTVLYEQWKKSRVAYNVKILGYVIMPEHFHIILWSSEGENIKTFLSRTLGEFSKLMQPGGGFWKERPRVLPIYSQNVLNAKLDYIHKNPLRRELVVNPEDWQHSSFRQLFLGDCHPEFKCDDWIVLV